MTSRSRVSWSVLKSACGCPRTRKLILILLRPDYDDIARRKYKKVRRSLRFPSAPRTFADPTFPRSPQDMDIFKPDHASYNKQRDAAQQSLALVASGSSSDGGAALAAAQDLYRDANSFVYADHKPSEDAIDRVIGKINLECVAVSSSCGSGPPFPSLTRPLSSPFSQSRQATEEVSRAQERGRGRHHLHQREGAFHSRRRSTSHRTPH